ncbi:MAG: carbonic anhydrase family protein [Deltaproteobacteria bacterium]|nr:MAG: carbonic anhydrase family protein [Deltaproteobacteria bacterium]TMQ20775.1 MAG: carbonic anhydrase family protein [Deltaproteobacteria bacterium]
MTRVLIALVVLASGCEQLKSPKRIAALEERVEQLSGEVEALKAGSGSGAKPVDHAGSGSGDQTISEAGSAAAGGEGAAAEAAGSAAGSDGPGSDAGSAAVAAGEGSAAPGSHDSHEVGSAARSDAGVADAGPDDRALADLKAVVSKMTGKQPGTPSPPSPEPGPAHWSYDGKTGAPTWGTLDPAWATCLKGKAQSPIDIEPRAGTARPIVFHYQLTPATIVDNGHTLQVNLGPGSSIEVDGRSYQLVQFHVHTPSEHTIAGERYPLELHLVHQSADGKLAVIGVLYDAGAESRALGALWSKWPRKVGAEDKLRKPFDPSELLPETRTVFRYPGSLTTPPCTEGVIWNVMRRAMSDSKAHLEELARHHPHNARETQALGDRKVE